MSSKRLERVSSISVQGMINENMYEEWQPKEKVAPECLTITVQDSEAVRVSGSKIVDRDNELSVSDLKQGSCTLAKALVYHSIPLTF